MKNRWYVKIWEEGHNFDFWHVSHFISGILFAYLVSHFDINLYAGFIFSFILMVGWELFEINLGIEETKFNMYFDVIFSVIAFWLTVYLEKNYFSPLFFQSFFEISLAVYSILGVWGFFAFIVRAKLRKM